MLSDTYLYIERFWYDAIYINENAHERRQEFTSVFASVCVKQNLIKCKLCCEWLRRLCIFCGMFAMRLICNKLVEICPTL